MPEEVKGKQFNLRYNCSKDIYERYLQGKFDKNSQKYSNKFNIFVVQGTSQVIETKMEWKSSEYLSENILRKEEHDWKMVYLARTEGSFNAKIQWKFDFSRENFKIKSIEAIIETHKYENGQIIVQYLNDKGAFEF